MATGVAGRLNAERIQESKQYESSVKSIAEFLSIFRR